MALLLVILILLAAVVILAVALGLRRRRNRAAVGSDDISLGGRLTRADVDVRRASGRAIRVPGSGTSKVL